MGIVCGAGCWAAAGEDAPSSATSRMARFTVASCAYPGESQDGSSQHGPPCFARALAPGPFLTVVLNVSPDGRVVENTTKKLIPAPVPKELVRIPSLRAMSPSRPRPY